MAGQERPNATAGLLKVYLRLLMSLKERPSGMQRERVHMHLAMSGVTVSDVLHRNFARGTLRLSNTSTG